MGSIVRTDLAGVIDFIDNLEDLFYQFPDVADDVAKDAFEAIREPMLDELADTPPKVRYPIAWTSPKQRRAFFATNGFGGGIPYRRRPQGMAQAWRAEYGRDANGISITIRNDDPAAEYVYGKLFAGGRDPQQQMHKNTGWQAARKTVDYWSEVYTDELQERYIKAIRERVQGK